ncbi:MAG: DUF3482 domain-containing protein [Desulfobacteraceae bacterium]|nr:DUF3482 domain-containing protein [Desulfobacteraceae bacterium]MBC2754767.1 DUF3482 domain-containing protein [Desulfobacteraceae bacterium]
MTGLLGGGSAAVGAKQATGTKVKGLPLGHMKIQVGPMKNEQILYILLDRALIYFSHVINWAHSRRDQPKSLRLKSDPTKKGFTSQWDASLKKLFSFFLKPLKKGTG